MMRLDRIIASTGILSRSQVKKMVRQGRIRVNGAVALSCEEKLDPQQAMIEVDGEELRLAYRRYYVLNKPAGYVSATEDREEQTVMALFPEAVRRQRIFPVGRLDKDAEGLLLLTDDGEYAHNVTAPKAGIEKEYFIKTAEFLSRDDTAAFAEGVLLKDGLRCLLAKLEVLPSGLEAYVTLTEGKYHQVKRMIGARGNKVTYLKRIRIGGLRLEEALLPGEFRELGKQEAEMVFYRGKD